MSATYTKLQSGEWGVKINGPHPVGHKMTVHVLKKSGEKKSESVKVIWSGNGISLCAVERSQQYTPYTGGRGKDCKTGGNCSSFGSGRSCGGHGCDGY